MKIIKVLKREEILEYLNLPPLDVPEDYSPEAAFKRGVETGDWSELECAARKVCRLMIEAAGKNHTVKRWLLATGRLGDREWNKLMVTIGGETPDIATQINRLRPSVELLWWSTANAALVVRGEKVKREEKQTDSG